jgi:hypothetical protein
MAANKLTVCKLIVKQLPYGFSGSASNVVLTNHLHFDE